MTTEDELDHAPLADWLAQAEALARQAGEIAMPGFTGSAADRGAHFKSPGDIVTVYDRKVEDFLRAELARVGPGGATVLGEEAGGELGRWAWVIDPIDGTENFAGGIPFWNISIGLLFEGRAVMGLVYDPNQDEVFAGIPGQGAWLNGTPLKMVAPEAGGSKRMGFGVTMKRPLPLTFETLNKLMLKGYRPRMPGAGALALAWVAAGRYHAYFEANMHIWDIAGATAVIEGAGGWTINGFDADEPQQPFAACAGAPGLREEILPVIAPIFEWE